MLILTASEDPDDANRAFELGAIGFIPNEQMQDTLVPALMDIAASLERAPARR